MTNLETSSVRFLDELQPFHVKDISRLTPGTKVIFGHVPNLNSDADFRDHKIYAQGYYAEIVKVEEASFNSLHSSLTNLSQEEWATKTAPVIFYKDEQGRESHRYASDTSVIPYQGTFFNDANFAVIVQDLDDAGLVVFPEVTAVYKLAQEQYNETVVEWPEPDYGDEY